MQREAGLNKMISVRFAYLVVILLNFLVDVVVGEVRETGS